MNLRKLFWSKKQRDAHTIIDKLMILYPPVREIFDKKGGVNFTVQMTDHGACGIEIELFVEGEE